VVDDGYQFGNRLAGKFKESILNAQEAASLAQEAQVLLEDVLSFNEN
jgi:hypothetical protein